MSKVGYDLYNNNPLMYWYSGDSDSGDAYMVRWKYGKQYYGYLEDPEPVTLDKHKLVYIGFGDYSFMDNLHSVEKTRPIVKEEIKL